MSDSNGDKEKLKTLLNAGLELRKKLFSHHEVTDESKALNNELLRISGAARTLAVQIRHPHGQACSMELQLAGRVWIMTYEEENREDEKTVEKELDIVQGIAKTYGDVNLVLRILELKAMLFNYTAETWKEVRVDEIAIAIGGRTPQRVVSMIGAYWRLIEAANISLVKATVAFNEEEKKRKEEALLKTGQKEEGERLESEEQAKLRQVIMEHNVKCWDEIQWLRDNGSQGGSDAVKINFEQFLLRYHVVVFGVCVFVGTMLSNPYISEWKQKDVEAAQKAFALAIHVAEITKDDERLCTAAAYRVRSIFGRATAAEQETMITELKRLQETKKPQGTDISDLLADIEKQRASFGSATNENTEEAKQAQQRIIQQLHQFQQLQQQQEQQTKAL